MLSWKPMFDQTLLEVNILLDLMLLLIVTQQSMSKVL